MRSVRGEFSSGVSICPYNGPQSYLEAHFSQVPPPGGTGDLSPALFIPYFIMILKCVRSCFSFLILVLRVMPIS